MEPMLIGAALGGGMSAARGGNPLTGALLGGIGGGVFGAARGAAGSAAGAAGTTAAGTTAAGTTAANLTAVPAFGGQAFQVGANAVPAAGIFSGGGTAALGGINPITAAGPSTGMIPSSLAPPSFMDTVTGGLKDIGQFTQQNPVLTQMGSQTAQSLLQNRQPDPAGLIRGSQTQAQAPQYKIGVPQFSLI